MAPRRFPDVLGIGTQRSGTTWLWNNLIEHPDFFVPRYKELDYLSQRGQVPKPERLKVRRAQLSALLDAQRRGEPDEPGLIEWFTRFAMAERNDDDWYASLFHGVPADRLAVDFSPSYAQMDDTQVAHAHALMPRARIVLMLRDPIDRAWSQLHFLASIGRAPTIRTPADFQRWCHSAGVAQYHAYPSILQRWRRAFGQDNVLVFFYEDVQTDPMGLLRALCTRLHVGFRTAWFDGTARTAIHKKTRSAIPEPFARAAAPVMLPHLVPLAAELDGPPKQWLARCTALLGM